MRKTTAKHTLIDEKERVLSPEVGIWQPLLSVGARVAPGQALGRIRCLGSQFEIVSPITGEVVDIKKSEVSLQFGEALATVAKAKTDEEQSKQEKTRGKATIVFAAPTSGRFYIRPAPDKPEFVTAGSEIKKGDVVCILEVMKTFNRIEYDGVQLPDSVRIEKVLVEDGADVEQGQDLFALTPL